ncbi:MAG: dihydrodipicolinate synthase family protein [Thermodesulfobacteriota bacterium]|nr:dihydrodipicolinate synthase family protein [Thermodesulfobacteriota bacterium]
MTTKFIYPEGSWVAIITPFDKDGQLDLEGMKELVDFQGKNGTSTLLIMGSTGEPMALSLEERKRIIKEMAPYCKGKISTFFGVTLGSTKFTIELAQYAEENGADGIVIVIPPYIAPPQEAVFSYLKDVCSSVNISVGLYNNPARVIVNIEPSTIIRLFHEVPNLVADKEAMPNVGQLAAVYEGTGGKLPILCCDSPAYALVIPTLGLGGKGTANITGNIHPRGMAEMSKPWSSWKEVENSRRWFYELLPLMEAAYSCPNPVAIKAMVRLLGLPAGHCRAPLPDPPANILKAMENLIARFEIKKIYGIE